MSEERKGYGKSSRQEWIPHWSLRLLYKLWMLLFGAAKIAAGAAATVLIICFICGIVFAGILGDYLQNDIMPMAGVDLGTVVTKQNSYLYYVDETDCTSITRAARYEPNQFLIMYDYAFRYIKMCYWKDRYRARLIQLMDYLFCRTSFACVERCFWRTKYNTTTPKRMVAMFTEQLCPDITPINLIHLVMRWCVKYRLLAVYYLVAYFHRWLGR